MQFLCVKRSTIIKAFVIMFTFSILLCVTIFSGSGVVYSGKTVKKLPIYSVSTSEKKVALSFDAAWGCDSTLKILKTLKDYDIKANFFVVGFWAEKYPELLKELSNSGHVEIGTHSNTHPHMNGLKKADLKNELEISTKLIEKTIGKKVELFRPPFGEYNDALIAEAERQKLFTIQWDVDSLDWKNLSADNIAARVVSGAKNGSIVLMHNDGLNTAKALPAIIERLKQNGFSFSTIGELIYKENFIIDHTGKQIKGE